MITESQKQKYDEKVLTRILEIMDKNQIDFYHLSLPIQQAIIEVFQLGIEIVKEVQEEEEQELEDDGRLEDDGGHPIPEAIARQQDELHDQWKERFS